MRIEGQCGGSKGTLISNSKIVCARTRVCACVCFVISSRLHCFVGCVVFVGFLSFLCLLLF